jgi:hypothetical protein
MRFVVSTAVLFAAASVAADETRQLDAHEHGVGALNIAIDGSTVVMELHSPGADIVGFEYAAKSDADRAAVDAAVATLAKPLSLFAIPAAAGCSVTMASASLEMSEHKHDHASGEHSHDHDHKHDEHASDDHKHDEHASDDHKHDDHDGHDHAEEASHSEFHAEYALNCAEPSEMTEIVFNYFDTFPNARELEVQIVSSSGAQAFEVERDAPTLDLRSLF